MVLVSAPPGYGKSTVLGSWVQGWQGPAAWVSLDPGDNDPATFLTHLAEALSSVEPGGFDLLRELSNSSELPSPRLLAGVLGNEVLDLEAPVLLILDDFQVVHAGAVHAYVDELVAQRPEGLTLVLGTRRDPPLQLASARSAGHLLEIRARELRLTEAQAAEVLKQTSGSAPSQEATAALHRRHEGWITGLRLTGLAYRDRAWPENPGDLTAVMDVSLDRLLGEVLSRFPDSLMRSLRVAAIFERFTPALVDYLLADEPGTGAALVHRLEQENLFLTRLAGGVSPWVRIHGLVRDLLVRDLDPAEVPLLHARAARWFQEHGLVEEGLAHAHEAGDVELAAEIVVGSRERIANMEQWSRLERWLATLPASAADGDPELLILAAWSADNRGLYRLMADRLDALTAAMDRIQESSRRREIQGEMAVLRGVQYYQEGRGREAVEAAESAIRLLSLEQEAERAYATIVAAMALQMIGDLPGARARLDEMMRQPRGTGTYLGRVLIGRVFVQWIDADLHGALETAGTLEALSLEQELGESAAAAALFQGMVRWGLGDLTGAAKAVWPTVDGAYSPNAFFFGHSAFVLALSLQARGLAEEATEVVSDLKTRRLIAGNPEGVREVEAFEAEIALRQGRTNAVAAWASQYEPGRAGVTYGIHHPDLIAAQALVQGIPVPGCAREPGHVSRFISTLVERFREIHNVGFLTRALVASAEWHLSRGESAVAEGALSEALSLASPGGLVQPFLEGSAALKGLVGTLAKSAEAAAPARWALEAMAQRGSSGFADMSSGREAQTAPQVPTRTLGGSDLTEREAEILGLLAERLSNREIAERLHISPATVKRHAATIYGKLGVHGRREAVARAVARGILTG
jgi:LuxR family maltose regulon positive regulatory protein